jgi:hypothetical protein
VDRPLQNTYWVLPGQLLAGEYPSGSSDDETRARLRQLLGAGIDFFLDLTQAGECPEYQPLLPRAAQHLRMAIADASVPRDAAQMHTILAHLRSALDQDRRVYVHCRAGIGRTATVIGCYLADQGLDGAAALRQLNELWQPCGRSRLWPIVPQTRAQAEFVRRWPGEGRPLESPADPGPGR